MSIPATEPWSLDVLPWGVDATAGHALTRVGDHVVDAAALQARGDLHAEVSLGTGLMELLAAGPDVWSSTRAALRSAVEALDVDDAAVRSVDDVELALAFKVADYVDFYSSIHHATNLGKLFRPGGEPLMPNWRRLPIGYHGRAGTVVVTGTEVIRPRGLRPNPDAEPTHGPSRRLDIELEVGFVVGAGSELGSSVDPDQADQHVFGVVLVNDWSARDIQAYEYQPLGPFLGKSFATSASAWITPLEALTPALRAQPPQDPAPSEHLAATRDWALDLSLEVHLQSRAMRETGLEPALISEGNFADLYWTFAQQLAHMTTNGASLRPGDLYASGTVSGPTPGSEGSFIELAWNGERPISLPTGEERSFLEDGDRIVLRGWGNGPDGSRIGLGEVDGTILPAR